MIGAIAQLGERLLCTQEVSGSIPLSSTTFFGCFENPDKSSLLSELLSGFFRKLETALDDFAVRSLTS